MPPVQQEIDIGGQIFGEALRAESYIGQFVHQYVFCYTGGTNYFNVSRLVYPIQGELHVGNQPNAATFIWTESQSN